MTQLREFARQSKQFEDRKATILAISADDREHAHEVWEKVAGKKFAILSDTDAKVARHYGLLHSKGHRDGDIAIRATLLLDEQGRERWRRVSETIGDIPSVAEVISKMDEAPKK